MEAPRVKSQGTEPTRLDTRRRAKRGLVAGYIHELSARHRDAGAREPNRRSAALAAGRKA